MAVCACDECDCIIALEPTLPEGAICDWCESDRHGKPLPPILTEAGAHLDVRVTNEGILLEVEQGPRRMRVVCLDTEGARTLADRLDLAIGGGQ